MPYRPLRRHAPWLAAAAPLVALAICAAGPAPLGPLALHTLQLFLASLVFSLPPALLLACLLARTTFPGRHVAMLLVGSLLLVPLYVQLAAWEAGFGMQGWASGLRRPGGGPWLAGIGGAAWIHALGALPWMTLVIAAGARGVPGRWEELGLLEAPWPRVMATVTLRHALPAVWAASLWLLAVILSEITVTDCYQVRTLAEELYTGFALAGSLWELHRRILPAGLLLAAGSVAVALAAVLGSRLPKWTVRRRLVPFPLGGHAWWVALAGWSVVVVILGVPIANLVYQGGLEVTLTDRGAMRDWSARRCAAMIAGSGVRFRDEWINSLVVAQLVSAGVLIVASPLAWWARRGRGRLGALALVTAAGLALPAPLLAVTLIRWMNAPGWETLNWLYDRTLLPLCVVHMAKALPLALLILWPAMRTVPEPLFDLARLDGWPRIVRYARLGLRLTLPAHAVAWMVVAASSLAELAGTVLVVPPGFPTLSVTIFQLVHYGVEDRLAGLCLALWGACLLLAAAIAILWAVGRRARVTIMEEL